MLRPLALLALIALAPLAAPAAQTMQPAAAPSAGTLRAGASGPPAELAFDVRARTQSPVHGCPGYVDPTAPDAVVDWTGGDMEVRVRSPFDATLLVHGPDGEWSCNDDAVGTSPIVSLTNAAPGRYAVWLGSFRPGPMALASTLYVGAPLSPPVLGASAPPASGILDVAGGFEVEQGLIEISIDAGGPDAVSAIDFSAAPGGAPVCTGYIDASRPTAGVRYASERGTGALAVSAASFDADLVMVVQGPDGAVFCNDDFEDTDPTVIVTDPRDGLYTIWVGTYRASIDPIPAYLVLSETEPEVYDDEYDFEEEPYVAAPYSEGTYVPLDLATVPRERLVLGAEEAEPVTVSFTTLPTNRNPVQGEACSGIIEPAPSVGVELTGAGPTVLSASAETDLVMVVQTPSGGWFCSDDANGLDPGVQIDVPEAGLYKVWVGTFGEVPDGAEVELTASHGELVVLLDDFDPSPVGAEPQSDGTYDGTEIRPGRGPTTAPLDASGLSSGTLEMAVSAGGEVLNPVKGSACAGFISEWPTAEVSSSGPVAFSATADVDLTLVARTPDGAWYCSDDADGTDPRVVVGESPGGVFAVWVGTFSRRNTLPEAVLTVEALSGR